MNVLLATFEKMHAKKLQILEHVKSPLLLAIRLYWGWQFFQTGLGKLQNVDRTAGFFTNLGIPFPHLNVYLAGTTEAVGGILLMLGLASRMVPFALIFTMVVAYMTAHREAVTQIFSKPDDFVTAPPFLFLFASVLVLVFGPGIFSVDHLIGRWWQKHKTHAAPATKS